MDELELLRDVTSDVPPVDDLARERARKRLEASIPSAQRHSPGSRIRAKSGRGLMAAAIAAVIVVVVLVVQAALPPGPGGPTTANATLMHLAVVASAQPVIALEPTDYGYVRSVGIVRMTGDSLVDGSRWVYTVRVIREVWIAADGSAFVSERYSKPLFESEADQRVWRAAGSPPLPRRSRQSYEAGELTAERFDSLPRSPDELESMIRDRLLSSPPGLKGPIGVIAGLLGESPSPPGLRRALFEVAAQLPGVTSLERAVDSSGRVGIGVAIVSRGFRTELIFAPDTSELLGVNVMRSDGAGGESLLQSLSYVVRGTVASTDDRPIG